MTSVQEIFARVRLKLPPPLPQRPEKNQHHTIGLTARVESLRRWVVITRNPMTLRAIEDQIDRAENLLRNRPVEELLEISREIMAVGGLKTP